ncbi:hypothetical protein GE09DRAFT_570875 [Coniochaeta sp. 2T2.1]|nr:hypothetical protein GE09DRAFT_570875 [Coniochaeta sp. 2T2.1]
MANDQDKSNSTIPSIKDISFGEDIDFVMAITAAALTANQLLKVAESKKHKGSHLAKAALGAAVTAVAVDMYQRDSKEHDEEEKKSQQTGHNADGARMYHRYQLQSDRGHDRLLTNGRGDREWEMEREYEREHHGRPEYRRRSWPGHNPPYPPC